MWVIHLSNEDDVGVLLLHLWNDPSPEIARHHLCHIATETVDAHACPVQEDVAHLHPSVGGGGAENQLTSSLIVNAIVEFYCFIPVILTHPRGEAVVACHLCRHFHIVTHLVIVQREVRRELRKWQVIEIVVGMESLSLVVIFSKVSHSFRLRI